MESYQSSALLCSICYIQYPKPVQQYQLNRPLQICYQCWFTHIKTALTRITYQTGASIISPFEGQPDMDVCQALNSLKPNQKEQLQQWLFKKYTTFTNDIQKCPSEACDYVFLSQKCRWKTNSNYNCPKCDVPLLPVSNFSIKGVLGYLYFLIFSSKCPKCQIPIQKTSGCPHMTCPCGHQFCWYCMKDYRLKADNVYSPHQSKQCAFIVMSKILLVLICTFSVFLTMAGHEGFQSIIKVLSQIFYVFIKAVFLDFIIAAQILVGTVIFGRHRREYVGFHQKQTQARTFKNYVILMVLLNIGIGYILYQMGYLMPFVYILLGQFCLLVLVGLSIYLVIWSVDSWFDFIA